jgi:hypothetical protein
MPSRRAAFIEGENYAKNRITKILLVIDLYKGIINRFLPE